MLCLRTTLLDNGSDVSVDMSFVYLILSTDHVNQLNEYPDGVKLQFLKTWISLD